jgi:VanZ family protein
VPGHLGKADIRIIHISRWLIVLAWLAVTAAMVAIVYELSGHAYARETRIADIVAILRRYRGGSATPSNVLAAISPAAADILFFLPWGALAFLSFDRENRRKVTYLLTMLLGVAFALGLMEWQNALPTRITNGVDAAWNVAGCALGCLAAHARKGVRFRFE